MTTLNIYNATRITTRVNGNGKHAWRTFKIEDATGTEIEVCAFADDGDIEQIRIRDEDEPRQRTNPETLMSGRVDEGANYSLSICCFCRRSFPTSLMEPLSASPGAPLCCGRDDCTEIPDDDTPAFCRPQAE